MKKMGAEYSIAFGGLKFDSNSVISSLRFHLWLLSFTTCRYKQPCTSTEKMIMVTLVRVKLQNLICR